MKSDNELENIDQRSVCSHYALYASGTNPTWLKKKTPHLLEIQNTKIAKTVNWSPALCHSSRIVHFLIFRGKSKTDDLAAPQTGIGNPDSPVFIWTRLFDGWKDWSSQKCESGIKICKPRLRVSRDAEDPFLIGRELISQGCDWPNENLVSVPAKQPKLFQVLLSIPFSIASRGVSRSNRVKNLTPCSLQGSRVLSQWENWHGPK